MSILCRNVTGQVRSNSDLLYYSSENEPFDLSRPINKQRVVRPETQAGGTGFACITGENTCSTHLCGTSVDG